MEKYEHLVLSCVRGLAGIISGLFGLLAWPFRKGRLLGVLAWPFRKTNLVILACLALAAAAVYFDPTGFFATWKAQLNHFFAQMNYSLSGLVNACIVIALLFSKTLQRVVLPFLDENLDAAKMWRGDPENGVPPHSFSTGEAVVQLAFAIVNAGTINAVFGLIGNFGTPLG